jgi:hypothetical protein
MLLRPARLVQAGVIVLALTVLAAGNAQARAATWAIQSTPNLHENASLLGVACPSATNCLAVGWNVSTDSSGSLVPLSEHWTGGSWTTLVTPNPVEDRSELLGVSCTSATACTAVGVYLSGGTTNDTLAERWNGSAWTVQTTPNPVGSNGATLNAVSCSSATACTAVGSWVNSSSVTVTLAERWNGTTWSVQTASNPAGATSSQLLGVSCKSSTACEAVGDYNAGSANNLLLAERWNGTSWAIQTVPAVTGATSSLLDAVSCSATTACTAVGNYNKSGVKTLAERWNGTAWSVQSTANPAAKGDRLFGVSCASATVCTAVGQYPNSSAVNITLAERWSGGSWATTTTPNPPSVTLTQLSAVACKSATVCTAVGFYDSPAFFWQQMLAERYS